MKKALTLCLCAALLLTLAGCGAAPADKTPQALPSAEPTAVPEADGAVPDADAEAAPDPGAVLAGKLDAYPADALVMTVDGREITWDLYYYWISNLLYSYAYQNGALPADYSEPMQSGQSLDEALRAAAAQYMTYYACTLNHAQAEGIALSAEEEAELEASWEAACENNGGEEGLRAALAQSCMTENSYRFYALRFNPLFEKLSAKLYADPLTAQEVAAWAQENNTVRAKHILLKTVDADGVALSQEDKDAARAQMEAMEKELAALKSNPAALEARFDELMNEKSEDTGLAGYPDGYVFTSGKMVQEFEDAAFALEDYGLSGIVETAYGYHLLLRLPMDADVTAEYDANSYAPVTVRDKIAQERMGADMLQWVAQAEIVTDPAFEDFTLAALFAA